MVAASHHLIMLALSSFLFDRELLACQYHYALQKVLSITEHVFLSSADKVENHIWQNFLQDFRSKLSSVESDKFLHGQH